MSGTAGALRSEELLALFSPTQQDAMRKVMQALKDDPAALDTHSRKQEQANAVV